MTSTKSKFVSLLVLLCFAFSGFGQTKVLKSEERIQEALSQQLKLNDSQQEEVRGVTRALVTEYKKIDALEISESAKRSKKTFAKHKSLHQIKTLLTVDQRDYFKELLRQNSFVIEE